MTNTARRPTWARLSPLLLLPSLLLGSVGCEVIDQIKAQVGLGVDEMTLVQDGKDLLNQGDLPGAAVEFERLWQAHPELVEVALGRSLTQVLVGDLAGADSTLAAVEATAGDRLGAVKLHRAMIAFRTHEIDAAKEHAVASGLTAGKLFAAEVHLVDLEPEDATALLEEVKAEGGVLGDVASDYLEHLAQGQPLSDLAEVTALWALGERGAACESSQNILLDADLQHESRDALLLLWAGRSVTSGHPDVAESLLDSIGFPPEGQDWRLRATQAHVAVANRDREAATKIFSALKAGVETGQVPSDGLNAALATACALTDDKQFALELVDGLKSKAIARCLVQVGALKKAPTYSDGDGSLQRYLESL